MKNIIRLWVISFVAFLLSQCQPPRQTADSSADEGAKLFVDNCARCHLSTGAGGPALGELNAPDLRQFTKSAAEIQVIITSGFGKMPSFKDSIPSESISQIATYVSTQIEYHSPNSK